MRISVGTSRLAAVLVSLPVAACLQTAAQIEGDRTDAAIVRDRKAADDCFAEVRMVPEFSVLRAKLAVVAGEKATMDHLTDTSKPTPAEAKLVAAFHGRIQHCRHISIASDAHIPGGASVARAYAAQVDAAYAGLIRRDISWGKANELIVAAQAEATREFARVSAAYNARLDARHQRELDYVDSVLPRTYNCRRLLGRVECTSN